MKWWLAPVVVIAVVAGAVAGIYLPRRARPVPHEVVSPPAAAPERAEPPRAAKAPPHLAPWAGWTTDVPSHFQPQAWTDNVKRLQDKLKAAPRPTAAPPAGGGKPSAPSPAPGGIEVKVVHNDCSEMPCISFLEMSNVDDGLTLDKDKADEYQRTLLQRVDQVYRAVSPDAFEEYQYNTYPVVESAVTGKGTVQMAISYVPLPERGQLPPGAPVTIDADVERKIHKRIQMYWR